MQDVPRHLLAGLCRRRSFVLLVLAASLLLLLLGSAFRSPFDVAIRLWPASKYAEDALECRSSPAVPRRSVCFLKTHKCASSSVQNVLMRYGESHGLRFVLPSRKNYLGHPRPFNRSMAPGPPPFDILAHHARFNEAEMRAVLGPDPAFVTIVREPASLFESLYSYYDFKSKTRLSLEQLSAARRNSSLSSRLLRLLRSRSRSKLGFNQMSFDLGLDPVHFDNESAVRDFVERLDATFDLVMVAERFNESLLLLRDLLCWSLDDVVVFRLNARQNTFRRPLTAQLAEDLRALNAADVQLYRHFERRFEQRVQEYGQERMARELRLLEERTRAWYQRCVVELKPAYRKRPGYKPKFWISSKVLTFRAKNESSDECVRLTLPELVFTERLRQKQFGVGFEEKGRSPSLH